LDTDIAKDWFASKGWTVFPFQENAWDAHFAGMSGLVNAPTGSGKTYSLFIPTILEYIRENKDDYTKSKNGLQVVWVTPIRALGKEIQLSCSKAAAALGLNWNIAIRSGDTTSTERAKQWKQMPEMLITTPESLHVMMATSGYSERFASLKTIVVDEWHELIGSKRGVQTELFISRMTGLCPKLKVWGISATIGNMNEAVEVLLAGKPKSERVVIKADIHKKIRVETLKPDVIEKFPWAGHLGLAMMEKVSPIIKQSKSTLIFTNTRAQCEIWYQKLLEADPELAGLMAMHHGSLSREVRDWVESALYDGRLKAVVCTSSLDLGVDFRPVETIVQIGSPKGVSRFIQRAGRSGHQPGAASVIYFVPTHSLELVEAAALREAVKEQYLEDRIPYIRSFDVLIQYLMTLAVSEGLDPVKIFPEVKKTFCYESLSQEEWLQVLNFLVYGSQSLKAYTEYQKVGEVNGKYFPINKNVARRHKMSIGTIVGTTMMSVAFVRGRRIGTVEEWFMSHISPGENFWFAGQSLELVRIKDNTAQVKKSKKKTGKIPSYMGGRLNLSSQMSEVMQEQLYKYLEGKPVEEEMELLKPLFDTQQARSIMPKRDEFLIEYFESKEGFHLLMYPFEGRYVHEGMGALLAKRISLLLPISFSIAMNDYGFELLSDREIDVEEIVQADLFSTKNLTADITASINAVEMAARQFRDIAKISGLIFQGYPGQPKKERHLQSSAKMIFEVFKDYEPDNLLYQQTYDEVMTFQLEEARLRSVLDRIRSQHIIISRPQKATPFAFPIMVDRLREKVTSEKLLDRIAKMKLELEKA